MNQVGRRALGFSLGAIGVSALALSCSAVDPGAGEDIAETTDAVINHGDPNQPANVPYTFSAGQGPVVMTSVSNSTCFLVQVGGGFVSSGDKVEIVSSGGNWRLQGTRGSGGSPYAKAFCAELAPPMTLVNGQTVQTWENQNPVDLLTTTQSSTSTCFLTSLWGNLGGAGEEVRTEIVNGKWRINGHSAGGAARCVAHLNSWALDFPWTGGGPTAFAATGVPLNGTNGAFNTKSNNSPWTCALTRISGTFRGSATVSIHEDDWGGTKWLFKMEANSYFQPPVGPVLFVTGSGRCIN